MVCLQKDGEVMWRKNNSYTWTYLDFAKMEWFCDESNSSIINILSSFACICILVHKI